MFADLTNFWGCLREREEIGRLSEALDSTLESLMFLVMDTRPGRGRLEIRYIKLSYAESLTQTFRENQKGRHRFS